jgi:hypothetical protein
MDSGRSGRRRKPHARKDGYDVGYSCATGREGQVNKWIRIEMATGGEIDGGDPSVRGLAWLERFEWVE